MPAKQTADQGQSLPPRTRSPEGSKQALGSKPWGTGWGGGGRQRGTRTRRRKCRRAPNLPTPGRVGGPVGGRECSHRPKSCFRSRPPGRQGCQGQPSVLLSGLPRGPRVEDLGATVAPSFILKMRPQLEPLALALGALPGRQHSNTDPKTAGPRGRGGLSST